MYIASLSKSKSLHSQRQYSHNKKQATPILESGLPDKDLQNAYALAFTVFQISVYLSSRASDV